ncbi:hypothetical protein AVEN_149678-1 [Araneus ventricosus]|uniref:DUF4817 domain-containing protein n=1 Tax=Araneus ventricosus TaxID=182803 RepID=A0A4Y2LQP9_ARAVE|nr:hypothetical protein AVEN_149678-1 [Araneus ventricosus]
MAWPPRSPDITSLDFCLWGYVKQHMYSERINDINHLKQRITDVTPDVLTRVWEELDYRLDVCRATNGAPALNSTHVGNHWFSQNWILGGRKEVVSTLNQTNRKRNFLQAKTLKVVGSFVTSKVKGPITQRAEMGAFSSGQSTGQRRSISFRKQYLPPSDSSQKELALLRR